MEIIGAGFGRTGTLSLKLALEILGFGPCYHMVEVFNTEKNPTHLDLWEQAAFGQKVDWQALFQHYRATVDWPGAAFYDQLLAVYPEARVILSIRDPEKWYQSACDTIYHHSQPQDTQFSRMVNQLVWQGTFSGRFLDKPYALEVFERHIATVQQQVPADKLLVYRVSDGWEPLCRFLQVPQPDQPFPRVNDTQSFQKQHLSD